MNQGVITYAAYEDKTELLGLVEATLPDLSALTQEITGAGISGKVQAVYLGQYDSMSLGLKFLSSTEKAMTMSEPRRHNIELRVANQTEDPVSGEINVQSEKHILVVIPTKSGGGSVKSASSADVSGDYAVRYWATYLDGKKVREIDPLNGKCIINGIDYGEKIRNALGK